MMQASSTVVQNEYLFRALDNRIAEALEDYGGVCIQGPKYSGKTWSGLNQSASDINLMDPSGNFQNREMAKLAPELVLEGEYPRLIDEWQEEPLLWDAVRNRIDKSGKAEKYILTGSSSPRKEVPKHSGIGRIEKLRMRTMSLQESKESSAEISLEGLFAGEEYQVKAPELNLNDICNLVIRGGWPGSLSTPTERQDRLPRAYIRGLIEGDLAQADGKSRDSEKVARFLHSMARNVEQTTATKTMIRDMTVDKSKESLSPDTITDYIKALKRIFVLEEIGPWAPNLRSPLRINKRPKFHFVDPSLPAAILGLSSKMLMSDLKTLGFLFEALCIRDLLVYAEAMGARVYYYRDKSGLEVDAVIEAPDGSWGAIEIKLGHNQGDAAASNLIEVRDRLTAAGASEPTFLAVMVGLSDFGYVRADKVQVVPVNVLGC